ncbi:diptericin A [Frankliniella occidentalis]|uniref:Diptericin A n=1 Tax=Frankliniella occidentalis TaxID=133901 RepID=A0A6J1S364_FRAOC|nr:diptericin A [Frankliniella occidentalis]
MHSPVPVALALLACAVCAVLAAPAAQQKTPFKFPAPGSPPPPPPNQRHGQLGGYVDRQKGVGTSVHINGQGDAWVSRNGNSRVTVDGHYGQYISGPAKGAKDYGGFVTFKHNF